MALFKKKKQSGKPGTIAQLRMVFTQARAVDDKLVAVMAVAALVGLVVPLALALLLGRPVLGAILGVLTAALAGMAAFGRRATKAQFTLIEGQPGAAAAVLQSMRGVWRTTPAVAVTRKQDFVHRVIGRPGIILVGEGAPSRVASLLSQERRRVARVAGEVPVHEVNVGTAPNQVPLSGLRAHLMKLPRAVKPRGIGALERRLSALGEQTIPIPKGPIPKAPKRR